MPVGSGDHDSDQKKTGLFRSFDPGPAARLAATASQFYVRSGKPYAPEPVCAFVRRTNGQRGQTQHDSRINGMKVFRT